MRAPSSLSSQEDGEESQSSSSLDRSRLVQNSPKSIKLYVLVRAAVFLLVLSFVQMIIGSTVYQAVPTYQVVSGYHSGAFWAGFCQFITALLSTLVSVLLSEKKPLGMTLAYLVIALSLVSTVMGFIGCILDGVVATKFGGFHECLNADNNHIASYYETTHNCKCHTVQHGKA